VSVSLRGLPLLAALLGGACGGTKAAPAPEAAASDGQGGWALVYERTAGGNQDLYVAPAGGGVERRITDHAATDALPRWRRDGAAILFGSDRSGNWQLYEVHPRGGEPRRLRTNAWREWQLDGSPDGRSLAFLSDKEGPEHLLTIYLINADGTGEERLSAYRRGGCEPRFSPDGRKVLYVSRGYLGKDASRLVERDLASGQEKVLVDWPALNYNPVYSPDASEVAFTSNITGDWVIYRQRLADGRSWRVTFGPGSARAPDYKPVR
jgi:TolB protein